MRLSNWITLPLVCVACAMLSAIWFAALVYDLLFGRARICPLCGSSVDAKRRYGEMPNWWEKPTSLN